MNFAVFSLHLDSNMPLCYSAIPSRSLRRDGADLKGFGILQRKNSRCIYVCPACGYNVIDETKIVSSKTVIWLCRFPKNSNIEVLTGAKRFIFLTPYSLASFCERFQVSDLIHTMPWHRKIGSDFLFCIIVYNTWTKRVGNLDYESINFCCGNRYTVVKGGE